MPYPAQINAEGIIETAIHMIEANGVDNLSLSKLAGELGVSAPSLYRYFNSKTALLQAINENTSARLIGSLEPALASGGTAHERIMQVARLYWDYAFAHPQTYGLLFTNTIDDLRPDEQAAEQGVLPYQALMAEISGKEQSLAAMRGFMALIHGFVTLVLAGQFRRGGDLDVAFEASVAAYLRGWER